MGGQSPVMLSASRLDFGTAGPSDRHRKTVTVTGLGAEAGEIRLSDVPSWLRTRLRPQRNQDVAIELTLDPAGFARGGRQEARLRVEAGCRSLELSVCVCAAGMKRAADVPAADGAQEKPPARQPPAAGRGLAANAVSGTTAVTGGLLLTVLYAVYEASAALLAGTTAPVAGALLITASAGGLYVGGVCLSAARALGRAAGAKGLQEPRLRALEQAVDELSRSAGLPSPPRLVLLPAATPNMRSCGLSPARSVVLVNRGLLDVLGGPRQLDAVVAHELAHIQRYDNLYFAVAAPLLALVRNGGAVAAGLAFRLRGGMRGPSPFASMLLMRGLGQAGWMGLFVICVALFTLLGLLAAGAFYAGLAILAVLGASACAMRYAQHLEATADAAAARLLGSADPVLVALAKCVDAYPSEMKAVGVFVTQYLPEPTDYGLTDIIRALKSGARSRVRVRWSERVLRRHPLLLERMSLLIRQFGTKLA